MQFTIAYIESSGIFVTKQRGKKAPENTRGKYLMPNNSSCYNSLAFHITKRVVPSVFGCFHVFKGMVICGKNLKINVKILNAFQTKENQ